MLFVEKKKRSKLWFKVYNHYNLSIWAKLLLETDKVGRVTSALWGYSRKKSCSKGTVQGWHQQEFRSRWHETEDGVFSSTDKRGTSPEDPPRSVHAHISLGVTKPSPDSAGWMLWTDCNHAPAGRWISSPHAVTLAQLRFGEQSWPIPPRLPTEQRVVIFCSSQNQLYAHTVHHN